MFQGLACRHSVAIIVNQQLRYDLCGVGRHVWDQLCNAAALLGRKVKLHVAGNTLKLGQQVRVRRAQDVVNLVHLVKFVVAREEGKQGEDFEVDAADAPVVHLVIVVAVGQQTLGRPVPARANVLSERWLGVDAAARAEVCQLDLVLLQ